LSLAGKNVPGAGVQPPPLEGRANGLSLAGKNVPGAGVQPPPLEGRGNPGAPAFSLSKINLAELTSKISSSLRMIS